MESIRWPITFRQKSIQSPTGKEIAETLSIVEWPHMARKAVVRAMMDSECPLLEAKRKTVARIELFRFLDPGPTMEAGRPIANPIGAMVRVNYFDAPPAWD
jgi:hypothetical protein